jgi:uncharacterized membrane protein
MTALSRGTATEPPHFIRDILPAMSSEVVLGLALGIGVIAGLRSMTAPAVVCWAAHLHWLDLRGSRLSFLGSTAAVVIVTLLAVGELVADKLPSTPNRTSIGPLVFRALAGALCGAALGTAGGASLLLTGIAGALGAIAGAFAGYEVRHRLVQNLKIPDFAIAIVEDLVAIGGGLLLVSRF